MMNYLLSGQAALLPVPHERYVIRIAGKLRKPAGAAEHCRQALMIVNPSFTLYKTFSIKCYSDHKHRIQWESREDWAGHAELLTEKAGLGGDPIVEARKTIFFLYSFTLITGR